jgi:hypothetical protein
MPEPGMPGQTFGGDDDDEEYYEEEQKAPKLDRYGLKPDANIRDVFWEMMGSYAASRKPSRNLSDLTMDRFALIRVAVTILDNPQNENYGLSPAFISKYTQMMLLDAGWSDAFVEFLRGCMDSRGRADQHIISSFSGLWKEDKYREVLERHFSKMLRNRKTAPVVLHYLPDLDDAELVKSLKKELIILARGDVGKNQLNAISALTALGNDPDLIHTLQILLGHWDSDIRQIAAETLLEYRNKDSVKKAASKRVNLEPNQKIREMLEKIVK